MPCLPAPRLTDDGRGQGRPPRLAARRRTLTRALSEPADTARESDAESDFNKRYNVMTLYMY